MKTLKTTIDLFAKQAINQTEMNLLRGGGADNPKDLTIPPPNKI
ncbi:hypothetical protein ACFLT1_00185 [Bacteroidota bacterium]